MGKGRAKFGNDAFRMKIERSMEKREKSVLRLIIYYFIFLSSPFSHNCTLLRDMIFLLVDFNLVSVAYRPWAGNNNGNIYITNNLFLGNGFYLIIVCTIMSSPIGTWCSRLCPGREMRSCGF